MKCYIKPCKKELLMLAMVLAMFMGGVVVGQVARLWVTVLFGGFTYLIGSRQIPDWLGAKEMVSDLVSCFTVEFRKYVL